MTFQQPCITECPSGWTANLFNQGTRNEHWVVTHYCSIADGGIAEVCEINTDLSPTEQEKVAKLIARAPKLQEVLTEMIAFLDQRADVDTDSDGQHPNEEMRLLLKLREVLK